jgi:DCN1-like protein 1/2
MGSDSETMDVDATQQYFTDIGVDLSDVTSLIAAAIVGCPTMGQVTQDGFVKGWSEAK